MISKRQQVSIAKNDMQYINSASSADNKNKYICCWLSNLLNECSICKIFNKQKPKSYHIQNYMCLLENIHYYLDDALTMHRLVLDSLKIILIGYVQSCCHVLMLFAFYVIFGRFVNSNSE